MRRKLLSLLVIITSGAALAAGSTPPEVAYPNGYRDWHHVKSMVIQPGHPLYESFGGIHHLYANPKAEAGYASGTFPDGAVIVFDLLAVDTADSAIVEGQRKLIGVMQKMPRLMQPQAVGVSKVSRAIAKRSVSSLKPTQPAVSVATQGKRKPTLCSARHAVKASS